MIEYQQRNLTTLLNGTVSDGTDAMGKLLFPDETGNGNMVYDQTASGIDVGDDIMQKMVLTFKKMLL